MGNTSENEFFKDIEEGIDRVSKLNLNGKRVIEKSREALQSNWINELNLDSDNYKDLFYKVHSLLLNFEGVSNELFDSHQQHLKWIREEIFEKTRIEINPDLPSRKKCIWLCTKDRLEVWWNTFENSSEKRIIQLDLKTKNSKIHIGDAEHLHLEVMSIPEWKESSKNYWSGTKTSNPDLEVLFEGEFEVINEFNKIEDIKNST